MKRYFYLLVAVLFSGMLLSSCSSSDYESVPLQNISNEQAFDKLDSLGVKAKDVLNFIYGFLPKSQNRFDGNTNLLDCASDDGVTIQTGSTEIFRLATGAYSATSILGSDMRWSNLYTLIRISSNFVSNIGVVPVKDTVLSVKGVRLSQKVFWKSEARFIRALAYFELIKRYGGVPLMGNHARVLGENVEIPRSSFEDCVNYIVTECDQMKDSIWTNPIAAPSVNAHKPTVGAVLALKARVLLYAASPLFNEKRSTLTNPLTGYTDVSPNSVKARWKKAADAAQAVINLNNYSLLSSFKHVFTTLVDDSKEANKELIFQMQFEKTNTSIETTFGPLGFSNNAKGNGNANPTQELVDAFPMNNGKAIGEADSGYDPSNPYDKRDPRLGYTVFCNGALWFNTPLQLYRGGLNNPIVSSTSVNKVTTKTSYYMRKFMGDFETAASTTGYVAQWHDMIYLRYAEVLLNYAEAANEYYDAPTDSIRLMITSLRKRAGIEAGTDGLYGLKANLTKAEMRDIIRNERRIELAFEEHRYWDIRRWMIAETVLTEPLHGKVIIKEGGALSYSDIVVYTPYKIYSKKMYLYPISYDEVIKNSQMVQNPGWE